MQAQQDQIDAVSNDLSNLDTTGYQAERVGFHDLLYTSGGIDNNMPVATGAGSAATVVGRSQAQGAIQQTGRPLDVALDGPGYLAVTEPGGTVGLTRNGVLEIDPAGRLTTPQGLPLSPPITLPPGTQPGQVKIATSGAVSVAGRTVGQLSILDVAAPDNLMAQGNSLFLPTAGSGPARAAAGTSVHQGALEDSNVDISSEMATMIDAQQNYAMASKAIDFQNQMLQIANGVKR
jgi:flagellar basal-body rod protein FlgG